MTETNFEALAVNLIDTVNALMHTAEIASRDRALLRLNHFRQYVGRLIDDVKTNNK